MSKYRLTKNAPFTKKIDALMAFLEENKIRIDRGYDGFQIIDEENKRTYDLENLDDNQKLQDIPSTFEYKITFTKD